MIIIKFDGGLGNQMLSYAFYRWLKEYRSDVKADTYCYSSNPVYCRGNSAHNGYELEQVFGLHLDVASRWQVFRLAGSGGRISRWMINKILNKIGMFNVIKLDNDCITGRYNRSFVKAVLEADSAYINAYCHSEKYFDSIADVIKRDFSFPNLIDEKNIRIAEEIKNTNSVSIHVRRGDYLEWGENGIRCDVHYYKRAIEYIEERVSNPVFFVFSNDMDWCKQNLALNHVRFVDNNIGNKSYVDMQLMSQCCHNIIPNSTFSWWGAWLNRNPNKIVIAPDVWYGEITSNDDNVVPSNWVRVRTGL